MPSSKCEGLSCPTHFLKNRGSVLRKKLNTELNKSHFLSDKMILCIVRKKRQNIYSKGIFSAPVVTHFILKV